MDRSSHIVITEPDSPSHETEDVPVVLDGKTYAPYRRSIDRLRVRESLRGDLKPGERIQVVSANDAQLEHMHRLFVTEGTNKSNYIRQYQIQAKIEPGAPLIYFIKKQGHDGNRYFLVAGQSIEGLGMKNEIQRRLRQAAP